MTPRLFTPPLRELTPATSLGFEVIEFADWIRDRLEELEAAKGPDDDTEYLELIPRLLEWQRWLLIHALELLPGTGDDLVFRFRILLFLVARQNGKTTLLVYLILWRMFQDGAKTVVGTAQSLDVAEEAWSKAVAIAEAIPELDEEVAAVNVGKSSQLLRLEGGERYKIAAANRRGARGLSGDLVVFDELREHQSWKAWNAASNTTIARARGQVWGVSNAGDLTSIVLRHLRTVALAQREGKPIPGAPDGFKMPAGSEIGIFEWSAGDERSVWDRDGWYEANPSLGLTEMTESSIAAAVAGAPPYEVETEVLCRFVNTAGAGPFPNGSWAAITVPKVVRDTARPAAYCVDLSHDRVWMSVAIAFWDTEGRIRVELVARRPGTDWVIPWLLSDQRKVKPALLTLQSRGAPISALREDFEKHFTVAPWEGPDLAGWTGKFYDDVRKAVADDETEGAEVVMTHGEQDALDLAAQSAVIKALGDGWVIDRNSSTEDVAPLVAAIGARGLLASAPAAPAESVYETHELMVV